MAISLIETATPSDTATPTPAKEAETAAAPVKLSMVESSFASTKTPSASIVVAPSGVVVSPT